jgi:hypothetical protein
MRLLYILVCLLSIQDNNIFSLNCAPLFSHRFIHPSLIYTAYDAIVSKGFFNTNATQIFAMSQAALSFQRRYFDATTNFIFPYLTIIVDVVDGVVRGIAWDDACVFCEESKCIPNTYNFDGTAATKETASQPTNGCYVPKDVCDAFHATQNYVCDLKLYVVWTGTDVNGNVLMSSDSRFSAFPPNRIQEKVLGSYNSMLSEVGGWGQGIKDKFGSLFGNN